MNSVYFACRDCKIYVDAGYRWACWELERKGLVTRGENISVQDVMSATVYWNPPQEEDAKWLREDVLPDTRRFLEDHRDHTILFGEDEDFIPDDDESFMDWMNVGYAFGLSVRYFAEVLHFNTWQEVEGYVTIQKHKPWWWEINWKDVHGKCRRRFEELVREQNT